jgi:hypothetical protein
VIRNLGVLVAGALAFWAALVALAYLVWDPVFTDSRLSFEAALVYSVVALLLCLVPAALTMLWAGWGRTQAPAQQVAAALGGTGVRLFFVLGAGLLLTNLVPYFHHPALWIWVMLFYLFTLALEVVLLVRGQAAANAGQ